MDDMLGSNPEALEDEGHAVRIGWKSSSIVVYRAGRPNPSNLRPRPVDQGKLSFRDTLSNPCPLQSGERPVFKPGDGYFGIDISRLPPGSVIQDDKPPGHVLIVDVTPEEIQRGVVGRGNFPK